MKPKFSKAEKEKILSHYYSNNTEVKVLAAQYGISRQTIYNWTKGKRRPSIIVPATTRPAPNWRDVRILKMQLEREKRIRKILQCANAALNSSINARLNAMEGLYKEDPVKYNIHILCDAFGVTRRLFYGHIKYNKRDNAWFKTRIPALKKCIRDIFNESEQRFGADKITVIMKERGLHVSVTIVRRLMREMRLHSIRTGAKRRWRLEIRNPVDRVKQQFNPQRPNEIWVSDVTEWHVKKNTFFICTIIDLYSRRVVAYKTSRRNSTHLVKLTLKDALTQRNPKPGLIFHSDRGSAYRSFAFIAYADENGITLSYSRSGKPYDNSICEAFFKTLKTEELYRRKYKSARDFIKSLADYIYFYNAKRPHEAIRMMTPAEKERRYEAERKKTVNRSLHKGVRVEHLFRQ